LPDFISDDEKAELEGKNLFSLAYDKFRELADDHGQWVKGAEKLTSLLPDPAHHVVLNLDTQEYLDPNTFGDDESIDNFSLEKGGVMKGLFSCLFYSTGRGGGDIEEFSSGRWAGSRVKIVERTSLSREHQDIS